MTLTPNSAIGLALKARREQMNVSLVSLSTQVGVSPSQIIDWEMGNLQSDFFSPQNGVTAIYLHKLGIALEQLLKNGHTILMLPW